MATGTHKATIRGVRTAEAKQRGVAVQTDQGNYGVGESQGQRMVSIQDERTWSILAHLACS
jgi:hypothetical protein